MPAGRPPSPSCITSSVSLIRAYSLIRPTIGRISVEDMASVEKKVKYRVPDLPRKPDLPRSSWISAHHGTLAHHKDAPASLCGHQRHCAGTNVTVRAPTSLCGHQRHCAGTNVTVWAGPSPSGGTTTNV